MEEIEEKFLCPYDREGLINISSHWVEIGQSEEKLEVFEVYATDGNGFFLSIPFGSKSETKSFLSGMEAMRKLLEKSKADPNGIKVPILPVP